MTGLELLTKLRKQGVSFTLTGRKGAFQFHADDGLSQHYVNALQQHAAEIGQILRDEKTVKPKYSMDDVPDRTCEHGHFMWAFRRDNTGWACLKCHPHLCR